MILYLSLLHILDTHDRDAIRLLGWPVVELENA